MTEVGIGKKRGDVPTPLMKNLSWVSDFGQ
jgi:hypothetical protein